MRPGPPPKPPELRLLQGNPGKRPVNAPKVQPRPGAECPDFLSHAGKAEWDRVYPELLRLGLVTMLDQAALACWCEALSNFKAATKMIEEEGLTTEGGNGTLVQHPAVIIQKKALENIRQFAAEFGFTPSARGRVHIPGAAEGQPDDTDRFFGPGPRALPPPPRPRPRKPRRA